MSDLGEREEALAAARETVDRFRPLAEQRPDAFQPNLALALMVLSTCLDAIDKRGRGDYEE